MSLTSLEFVCFLLAVILGYYLIPQKLRWYWLLAASLLFFYLSCGLAALPYLAYGIVVTYVGAQMIPVCKSQGAKKAVTAITVVLALIELFLLKYMWNIRLLFVAPSAVGLVAQPDSLIAPIGISYYTLSIVGYVIDVYRGTAEAQQNILKHALFTAYFPQAVSGPVVRYGQMESQLFTGHPFKFDNLSAGGTRMLWGYFKKLVIADRLAVVVASVYSVYYAPTGIFIVFGTIAYAFQLYADFSGCMDIVLGMSECLGIRLPENFNAPFFSRTISEFWRRWHITLGLWFKDYLMYPLLKSDLFQNIGTWARRVFGKKNGKKVPTYLVLIIVWFCIGIWHGATPQYMMASGILPGFFLISSELLQPLFAKLNTLLHIRTESTGHKIWGCVRTILLMCICFVFARAEGLSHGISMITDLFNSVFSLGKPDILHLTDGSLFNLGLDTQGVIISFIGILLMLAVDYIKEKGTPPILWLQRQSFIFRVLALWGMALSIMCFGMFDQSQFIYFQF